MFGSIAKRYDLTNDVLSLGMHRLWRKQLVNFGEVRQGMKVLDLCTGTGDLALAMRARVGEEGNVYGLDFSLPMVELARKKGTRLYPCDAQGACHSEKGSLHFAQGDALNTGFPDNTFDLVGVAFGVRNLDSLSGFFEEAWRVLKWEGRLLILEFGQPHVPVWRDIYRVYSRYVIPTLGWLCTGNRVAYEYLPRTSAAFPCGARLQKLISEAGFRDVVYRAHGGGIAYSYRALKRSVE